MSEIKSFATQIAPRPAPMQRKSATRRRASKAPSAPPTEEQPAQEQSSQRRRTRPQWRAVMMPCTPENKVRILTDAVRLQQQLRAERELRAQRESEQQEKKP